MSEPTVERLVKIESHLAHLEQLVEELNCVVIAQGKSLARLEAKQTLLSQTVETQELERIKATNARPPHYQ